MLRVFLLTFIFIDGIIIGNCFAAKLQKNQINSPGQYRDNNPILTNNSQGSNWGRFFSQAVIEFAHFCNDQTIGQTKQKLVAISLKANHHFQSSPITSLYLSSKGINIGNGRVDIPSSIESNERIQLL